MRLTGPDSGPGAAGHWTDAASGDNGDLLDLIAQGLGLGSLGNAMEKARRFLNLPDPPVRERQDPAPVGSPEAARRLWAMGQPIEPDLDDLLRSMTNVFHRMTMRVDRDFDASEQAQRRSQRDQDGTETRSVELETQTAEGITFIEGRNAYGSMRDLAADLFETHLGQALRPHSGSKVTRRTLTAAMIDNLDHLSAKRRSEIEPLPPTGAKIAFAGGSECNDTNAIWAALDKIRAKHADMVLLHGGSPKGSERIAACWADNRKCPQIVFNPDWTRHGKSAPLKRNDRLLDTVPMGLVVFPGSGITDNLADKAPGDGRAALRLPPPKGGIFFALSDGRTSRWESNADIYDPLDQGEKQTRGTTTVRV